VVTLYDASSNALATYGVPGALSTTSVAAGAQSTTCAVLGEGTATYSCPGGLIAGVTFAAYGLPTGSCAGGLNTFAINAICDAGPGVRAKLTSLCVGQASCTVSSMNSYFGVDPCPGYGKRLAVALTCGYTKALPASAQFPPATRLVVLGCLAGSLIWGGVSFNGNNLRSAVGSGAGNQVGAITAAGATYQMYHTLPTGAFSYWSVLAGAACTLGWQGAWRRPPQPLRP
jgi:hypothetical protein